MTNEVAIPDDIQKLLNEQMADDLERESGSDGDVLYISTRGKKFRSGDLTLPNPLLVVIAFAGAERSYYDSAWDPNNSSPPACFALGTDPKHLTSHETSPNPQHDGLCDTCPLNEWGSGSGNSKACKEGRKLIMFSYDKENNEISLGQKAVLKIAPTGLSAFASYTKGLANRFKRTTSAVVTKLSFDDRVDYPKLEFTLHEMLDNEQIMSVLSGLADCKKLAMRAPNVEKYEKPSDSPAASETTTRKSKMS